MAVNQSTISTKPEDVMRELMDRIDTLAASGEWGRIERLAIKVRSIVMQIPPAEREAAILQMGHCLDRVQSKAFASRVELKDKLSDLRRGRVATAAYGQRSGQEARSALR